jgi:hypothetical protein
MPSQSKETREKQKKSYDELIQARQAELKKKGLTAKDFNKDKVYEHLKAKQRAIVNAIAAIDARTKRIESSKEAAAEPAAPVPAPPAPKEKKPKKEKSEKSEKPAKAEKAAPAKTAE